MNARLLLVDDDEDWLSVTQKFLIRDEPSFEITTSSSAQEALKKLKNEHFDIIISDYRMPSMDGLALLEQLRKKGNDIPFIMLTGQGREEVAIRALNLGADYYLKKEVNSRSLCSELAHIIRNVVHYKQTEEALRKSEERFSKAFRSSPQALIISRISDGLILEVNESLEKAIKYSHEELIGKKQPKMGLIKAEDRERAIRIYQDQGLLRDFEIPFYTKSGEERVGLFSGEIIEIHGEPCIIQVINDITDRKKAEERLQRQKMELSEFIYAIAHDLRSHLLSIESYADILQDEYDKAYIEKIRHLAHNMSKLLRHSVTLADAGLIISKTDELNLTLLVRDVATSIIPKSISFSQDTLPKVEGDREKLVQVFQNLFENAITHAHPSRIEVRRQDGKNGTNILIINDGALIPSEYRKKIFEHGFTTKEKGGGLGLTIVQKLVEAHSWKISLETSSVETIFRILIPEISNLRK